MLREHDRKLRTLLLLTDVLLCAGIVALAGIAGPEVLRALPANVEPWQLLVFTASAVLALPLAVRAVEREPSTRLDDIGLELRRFAAAGGFSAVVLAATAFAAAIPIGPGSLLGGLVAQLVAVGTLRVAILYGLRLLRRRGRNFRNVVVIGTGPRASTLTETIVRHPEWGLRIIGYVDDGDVPLDGRIPGDRVYKMVDFGELLREHVVDEVITACPRSMLATLGPALESCSAAGVPLTVMTDLFGDYLPPPKVKRFAMHEALSFAPVHHSPARLAIKRGLDIVGALAGLAVSAPLLLLSGAAIRLDSRGPVFFRQIRCGLHGRPFVMLKLRTMVSDAEERRSTIEHMNEMSGPVFKVQRDPRVTRVGRWLRIFSIDELPQLFNVLAGDMSLVGPRPPIPAEVAQYETSERRRLSMRPGLTCLWQVSGRNNLGFDEWVKLDIQYIDGWSLTRDLKILALTVPAVLRGTGS